MKQFSNTKLGTYERCPLQYKLEYLTSIKPEKVENIQAFVGSRVHEALEVLYRDLLKTKLNSLEELLEFYRKEWEAHWEDTIDLGDKGYDQKHWYNYGEKCIKNYYEQYKPFDQDETLGVEKKILLQWGDYEIIGYIDRMSRIKRGEYAVHDYKTGIMSEQKYADKDRQLALYAMWALEEYKEARDVKLIWHYVGVGEDIVSSRTKKQFEALKEETLNLIEEMNRAEREDDFPAKETMCEWCDYWEYCPKKKHLYKTEQLPENEYLKEGGVQLAQKYIELSGKKSAINKVARTEQEVINEELLKIEEAILAYAEKNDVEVLDGGERIVAINKKHYYNFPRKSYDLEKYEELEKLLRGTKHWPDVSVVADKKLEELLEEEGIDDDLKKKILELAPKEESVSLSVKKK